MVYVRKVLLENRAMLEGVHSNCSKQELLVGLLMPLGKSISESQLQTAVSNGTCSHRSLLASHTQSMQHIATNCYGSQS